MARSDKDKKEFLKNLEATPFISYACKKSGVARATVYRWMRDSPAFRKNVLKALHSGRENLSDVAEMALVTKVKGGEMAAIKFFLEHNSKRYGLKTDLIRYKVREQKREQPSESDSKERFPEEVLEEGIRSNETWKLLKEEAERHLKEEGGDTSVEKKW